jgi:hypothetical protein
MQVAIVAGEVIAMTAAYDFEAAPRIEGHMLSVAPEVPPVPPLIQI